MSEGCLKGESWGRKKARHLFSEVERKRGDEDDEDDDDQTVLRRLVVKLQSVRGFYLLRD